MTQRKKAFFTTPELLVTKRVPLYILLLVGVLLGLFRSIIFVALARSSRLSYIQLHGSYLPLVFLGALLFVLCLGSVYNSVCTLVHRRKTWSVQYNVFMCMVISVIAVVLTVLEYVMLAHYLKFSRHLGSFLRLGFYHFISIPLFFLLSAFLIQFLRQSDRMSTFLKRKKGVIVRASWALFGTGLAVCLVCSYCCRLTIEPWNIILMSIDTMRADHLGCYGYPRKTPAMDWLSRKNLLFQTTITSSPWTLPSHMSMLTGLYPWHHGVNVPQKLDDEKTMIAEVLSKAGYQTTALTGGGYLSDEFNYQGFRDFRSPSSKIRDLYGHIHHWLKHNRYHPFFLFLHTYQPHCPYDPPPEYDIYSDPHYRGIVQAASFCGKELEQHQAQLSAADYDYLVDKYDGEIFCVDVFLGYLFRDLIKNRLFDGSLIILTSDHGENFADNPAFPVAHNELYDEIVQVPLIIKLPFSNQGRLFTENIELVDLFPTILDAVALSSADPVDGQSLLGLIADGQYKSKNSYCENIFKLQHNWHYKMVRGPQWKLIHRSENELELYDLKNDPDEKNDLGADKTDIVQHLMHEMNNSIITDVDRSTPHDMKFHAEDKSKLADELRALGYIE